MKVVIISDLHDNLVNLKKCLNWCQQQSVEKLICCGDLTNSETLKALATGFTKTIYLVKGNIEIYDQAELSQFSNINYFGQDGSFILAGRKVGLCHPPSLVDKILNQGQCDIIFYGHTHQPWLDEKSGVKIVNPGTMAGMFNKATFAIWQPEKELIELKILELI